MVSAGGVVVVGVVADAGAVVVVVVAGGGAVVVTLVAVVVVSPGGGSVVVVGPPTGGIEVVGGLDGGGGVVVAEVRGWSLVESVTASPAATAVVVTMLALGVSVTALRTLPTAAAATKMLRLVAASQARAIPSLRTTSFSRSARVSGLTHR
jgi:hypothetical protein